MKLGLFFAGVTLLLCIPASYINRLGASPPDPLNIVYAVMDSGNLHLAIRKENGWLPPFFIDLPLWLPAGICLAWPVMAFLLPCRQARGFAMMTSDGDERGLDGPKDTGS